MQSIALIDYGAGNIPSVERALNVALTETDRPMSISVTSSPETLNRADRIVIPGVGHFKDCRENLAKPAGMLEALENARSAAKPILGICVGMQLMADLGLEDGKTNGLGWIPGEVDAIPIRDNLPIPHMGWNELSFENTHPVLDGINPGDHAYFVHSYHFRAQEASDLILSTEYGTKITAAVARETLVGVQFHPEISQKTGLTLLKNWIKWTP